MSYYAQPYYQTVQTSSPITMPAKTQAYYQTQPYYQTSKVYGSSPPEIDESVSSGSGAPSYGNSAYSATSGSYAGSASDYDTASSANGVDLHEYMQDRFSTAFDPLPLDRSLATQAQTSGKLNAKHREILELQAKAQARLVKSRARFAEGMQDAKDVKRDLEWSQKRVSSLKTKASKKHPKEYKKAHDRYPSPEY